MPGKEVYFQIHMTFTVVLLYVRFLVCPLRGKLTMLKCAGFIRMGSPTSWESSGSAQLTLHSVSWFHKCPPIFGRYFLCIYQNTRQCASETLTAHSPSLFSETSKMRLPLNVYLVFRLVVCGPGLDLQSYCTCSGDEQDRKRARSSLPSAARHPLSPPPPRYLSEATSGWSSGF